MPTRRSRSRGSNYGAPFFMATGFHGFHVLVGTIFLIVNLVRAYKGHFTPRQHFGFEAAAWYWHFVDVVWLFLFAPSMSGAAGARRSTAADPGRSTRAGGCSGESAVAPQPAVERRCRSQGALPALRRSRRLFARLDQVRRPCTACGLDFAGVQRR